MQFFRAEDGVDLDDTGMMTRGNEVDPEIFTTFDTRPLMDGSRVTVLFKGEGADGFSLVHAWFGPGYRLPRHSHSADCLYYVVKGELRMGTRVLRAGDGFFVAAEAPYTYTAGPDGVEVLEFRAATTFDIKVRDQTIEAWRPIMAAAAANHEKWVAAAR
jgi:quercetin dioxygenase-like cupin family protein